MIQDISTRGVTERLISKDISNGLTLAVKMRERQTDTVSKISNRTFWLCCKALDNERGCLEGMGLNGK